MRPAWFGLLFTLSIACHRGASRSPDDLDPTTVWAAARVDAPSETPFRNVWLPTEKLVSNPELRDLVDELTRASGVYASAVGYAGRTPRAWVTYERLAKLASPRDKLALLSHPSPVVRGYLLEHPRGAAMPDGFTQRLYELLSDASGVFVMSGCTSNHPKSIAQMAFAWLLPDKDDPARPAFLARVASDPRVTHRVREAAQAAMAADAEPAPHESRP